MGLVFWYSIESCKTDDFPPPNLQPRPSTTGRNYLAASNALGKDRSAMLDACGEEIERGFEILGATAIEDRLQDEVPETLR